MTERERDVLLRALGSEADLTIEETANRGHAAALACRAMRNGTDVVVAFGGDGTVNEVGCAVVEHPHAALGVIPSGSGNGLARELSIPFDPKAAFAIAFGRVEHRIDCGELDGRYFFNLAGLGLDARVAHQFAARGLERRGFRRYVEITLRELFRREPDEYTIVADGVTMRTCAMLVALANGRQYGNGALIAPAARLDDGNVDVVIVEDRAGWRALLELPFLFAGQANRMPGVRTLTARRVEVTSQRPVLFHVDGEPHIGGERLVARVHDRALRVRVPVGRNGGIR